MTAARRFTSVNVVREVIMSNTPGISPITTDIEEIRRSDDGDRDLLGDEQADDPDRDKLDRPGHDGSEDADKKAARIGRSTLDLA